MLEVQKYLKNGKSLDDLTAELGIKVAKHQTLPLVILNYCQIESPKTNSIVRECRALVLNSNTFDIVARSFSRFFNWGEVTDEMNQFDFSDFCVHSKEDGSLVLIYFFENEWRINTRGSFATDAMQFQDFTWQEGILKALNLSAIKGLELNVLNPDYNYVFEFCSPWNKVVRQYDRPVLYLLGVFHGEREFSPAEVEEEFNRYLLGSPIVKPDLHKFSSITEIQKFLEEKSASDPTFEGVVIRDKKNCRFKLKNPCYLSLHRIRGEGNNLFNPKHLLPFILSGEDDELLTYYNEVRPFYFEVKSRVQEEYIKLLEVWVTYKEIEDQKEFALTVKNHKFSGILFQVRKQYAKNQTVQHLKQMWRDSDDLILKAIK
jgi:hypothetical protein